jgi:hypothetical protein
VRYYNTSEPGGTFSGGPDEYKNLLPMLESQGHLDMVFSDDTEVDYSLLTGTYDHPGALTTTVGDQVAQCPSDSVALFSFTATLQNRLPTYISEIYIFVDASTSSGVGLLNPNGSQILLNFPPDNAAQLYDLTPPDHVGTLNGGESIEVPFNLCLKSIEPFNFFVNVRALVAPEGGIGK